MTAALDRLPRAIRDTEGVSPERKWSTPPGLPDNGLSARAVVKERGYEGLVAKDAESVYRGGPTRSWVKVKFRREGRFIVGGVVGWTSNDLRCELVDHSIT